MTCTDCGADTLSDGVCIDCSDNRFHDYPRLKAMEDRIKEEIKKIEEKPFLHEVACCEGETSGVTTKIEEILVSILNGNESGFV